MTKWILTIWNITFFGWTGSLNRTGRETLPVSQQESLEENNSEEEASPLPQPHKRKSPIEVTIINGLSDGRRLAPLEFCDDDEEEEEEESESDLEDNEHSRITTSTRRLDGSSRRDSNCSLDSIIVSGSNS